MFRKKYRLIALTVMALALSQAVHAIEPEPRIVGGKIAANHAYPFIVSLEDNRDGFPFCGGTLLTPTKVLTAAHCVDSTPTQIRLGTNNKNLNPGQVINVASAAVHPKYNDISIDYDVAVLTLASPVTLSNSINVIGLPEACLSLICITGLGYPGTLVRVAGWGGNTSEWQL